MLIDDISLELTLRDDSVEVVSSKDRLVSFNVLYELDSELEGVNGKISANELTFGLLNTDGRYSLHNEESELYNKIGNGVVVRIKDKGVVKGTFTITEWSSPRGSSNVANIRATDRLQVVLNSGVEVLDVDKEVILYDYIVGVLNSVGISIDDIVIDEALKYKTIKFTITEGFKLSSLLNDIALSYDLYIYVNTDNKIVICSKDVKGDVVHTLSDSVNVYALDTKDEVEGAYNTLNINYKMPQLSDVVDVLTVKELSVPCGTSHSELLKVENSNLYDVDTVRVDCKYNVDVEDVKYNKKGIKFTFSNADDSERLVDVVVRGRNVEVVDVVESISDVDDVSINGAIALDVNVVFVQSKSDAVVLRDKLWGRLSAKHPYMHLSVLCNDFSYALGDICNADIRSEHMEYRGYIHSIRYNWSGGNTVRCELGLKRVELS